MNPKWDQQFVFPISLGTEDLYVEVINFDKTNNTNRLVGKFIIQLEQFRN